DQAVRARRPLGARESLGDLEEQLGQAQVEGGADGLEDLRGGLLAASFDLRQVGERHPGGLGDLAQGAALVLAPPAQRLPDRLAQLHRPTTSSTRPYSSASAAENQVSRSVSRWMRSTGWPVAAARGGSMRARWRRISSAARSRSVAWPWNWPAHGWWIRTRALAVPRRWPLVPEASSTEAIEAAMPAQVVATGQDSPWMVSTMARPLRTSPPGELIRSSIGSQGRSPSRHSRGVT